MHNLFLGVAKQVLSYWLDQGLLNPETLDQLATTIKTPSNMNNWKWSFEDVGKWKAITWRYFVCYFSTPMFEMYKGSLSDKDLRLWEHLVRICHISCCSEISDNVLEILNNHCHQFVELSREVLNKLPTANIHTLLHLKKDIERNGLLW